MPAKVLKGCGMRPHVVLQAVVFTVFDGDLFGEARLRTLYLSAPLARLVAALRSGQERPVAHTKVFQTISAISFEPVSG
ncbi:hypothetical protein LJR255_001305 [Pararhizobium sp. LjRoot255]|uniref:hypothetical protein n=1 Tax=Pararhizobium sp. LjRoot255 TaxID=3342298 RepID=UPI003ECF513B